MLVGLTLGAAILATACSAPTPTMTPGEESIEQTDTGSRGEGVQGAPSLEDEEPTPEPEATPALTEEAMPEDDGEPADEFVTPDSGGELDAERERSSSPKLESRLAQLAAVHERDGLGPAGDMAAALGLQLQADRVLVVITAASPEQAGEVVAAVEAVGGTVDGTTGPLIQAWLPISRLDDLAANPAVLAIQGAQAAAPASGALPGDAPAGGPMPTP